MATRDDQVGRRIADKYRVVRHLGAGGLAEVYEAVHEQIGQRFAIKILRRELVAFPELTDRFLVEARAASAVGHPGIVQVFDIGRLDSGEPYLVMELLQGDDLGDFLRRHGRLEADSAIDLCLHVLDALAAAHRVGVVHRDLKPENILLVRGPAGEPWAKIIDFGIARLVRQGPGEKPAAGQGAVLGTPYYAAPEQVRGIEDVDGRADLYSVGVILYELVTGRLPYDGGSVTEIIGKVLSQPFPEPRAVRPSVSPELQQVILKATAKNRDQRFATAEEFADALRPLRTRLAPVRPLDAAGLAGEDAPPAPAGARKPSSVPTAPPRLTPARHPSARSVPGTSAVSAAAPRRPLLPAAAAVLLLVGVGLLWLVLADREVEPRPRNAGEVLRVAAGTDASGTGAAPWPGGPPVDGVGPEGSVSTRVAAGPAGGGADAAVPGDGVAANSGDAPAVPAIVQGRVAARIRLAGLPPEANVTLDGVPVEAEFRLPVGDVLHTVRVVARDREPFVRAFRVTGDQTIDVRMPEIGAATSAVPTVTTVPTAAADTGPRALANPFP